MQNNNEISKTSRQYKDSLFRNLFYDNKRFLELYNAVADDHIPDNTAIIPCSSNSLLARYNDLAALIGSQLVVFFEHSSTVATNMPLRMLQYAVDILYSTIVDKDELYGSTQVIIPTPVFYVLYNGEQRFDSQVMKLSDAYVTKTSEPSIELSAKVVNINYGSGEAALERSNSLKGYSYLIAEVRKNLREGMTRDAAIVAAIEACIAKDILKTFLSENFEEVIKMLNYEYDAEAERRVLKKEGRQEGRNEIIELLEKIKQGDISVEDALTKAKHTMPEAQ